MSGPVKDPLTPDHKRFVLGQAGLRLAVFFAAVGAIAIWFAVRG